MTATFQKKNNEPLTPGIAAVWEFDAVPGDAADYRNEISFILQKLIKIGQPGTNER